MALIIKTSDPTNLLTSIKKLIDSKEIVTWSYDSEGDFTHTPDQWKNKGYMRPKIGVGELKFGFVGNIDVVTTNVIYAIYHGRFSEMLLTHFDREFTRTELTAVAITGTDYITKTTKTKE